MFLKRAVDLVGAALALLAAAPVLAVVAVAIRRTSPGPVFFKQERVGRHGETFMLYKLRSMRADAATTGYYFTTPEDPRVTPVGRFIRRTSLDELPQLWNVLRGDMSLIGPRPDVPLQRANYTEAEWETRHHVRPGITGLAQATLRSAATEAQRKALDLQYVAEVSLGLDARIILLTIRQVLGKGGY